MTTIWALYSISQFPPLLSHGLFLLLKPQLSIDKSVLNDLGSQNRTPVSLGRHFCFTANLQDDLPVYYSLVFCWFLCTRRLSLTLSLHLQLNPENNELHFPTFPFLFIYRQVLINLLRLASNLFLLLHLPK